MSLSNGQPRALLLIPQLSGREMCQNSGEGGSGQAAFPSLKRLRASVSPSLPLPLALALAQALRSQLYTGRDIQLSRSR